MGYHLGSVRPGFPPQAATMTSSAYADWHGAAITVAGGLGFLFLVATGGLSPAPWRRTPGVAVVGVAIIVFTIVYSTTHWNHFPVEEFGGLLAIIAATGLLVVACIEIRRSLERRFNASPDAPGA